MKHHKTIDVRSFGLGSLSVLALMGCNGTPPMPEIADGGIPGGPSVLNYGGQGGDQPTRTGEFATGGAPVGGASFSSGGALGGSSGGAAGFGGNGTGGASMCSPDSGTTKPNGITGTVELCPCAQTFKIPLDTLPPCKMTAAKV